MKNNQKGFGALELIMIVVVVCLIGGVGWYVWQSKSMDTSTLETPATMSSETANKPEASNESLEISALGVKVNDPDGRGLQVHAEKICISESECEPEDSHFIRDDNDEYFARCDYPTGISKLGTASVEYIKEDPTTYIAKMAKKIGDDYFYVNTGSNFQAPCNELQGDDESYEKEIRQYVLENMVKL